MTHSTADTVWTTDTVDVVTKALRQAGEPVTAKKLREQLSGPHRLPVETLTDLLERQVAAGRLFRFSPYMSKLPRYGTDDHQQHACRVMETVLASGPHTIQSLQQRVSKRLADCPANRRKELLESLVREGRVRHLPPIPGSRTNRYGIHPPDPVDYVRKHVNDLLGRVRKQAQQLAAAGVDQQATWEAARRLLLDGIGRGGLGGGEPPAKAAAPESPASDSAGQSPTLGHQSPAETQRLLIRAQLNDFREDPRRGPLVPVTELRQALDSRLIDKPTFDEALLEMARKGLLSLYQHDYPASLSEHERETLVRDAEGNYYNGVSLKEGS